MTEEIPDSPHMAGTLPASPKQAHRRPHSLSTMESFANSTLTIPLTSGGSHASIVRVRTKYRPLPCET